MNIIPEGKRLNNEELEKAIREIIRDEITCAIASPLDSLREASISIAIRGLVREEIAGIANDEVKKVEHYPYRERARDSLVRFIKGIISTSKQLHPKEA